MPIVDSQVHIWENETMNSKHRQVRSYSAADALAEMTEAGVEAALLHPPSTLPNTNATAIQAAKDYPGRFAILGHFDLRRPDGAEVVANWTQQTGMLGFRFTLNQPYQQPWWDDDTLDWFWAAAERAGTPVGLLAGGHLRTVVRVAERHPGLRLLIDHYGRYLPRLRWDDLDELLGLARLPNVAVKVSGAPAVSGEAYPYRDMVEPTRRIVEAFGPERAFWGTDITRMPCTYRQCVTQFTEEMPWLTGRARELVMGDALCAWVGWNR